MSVIEIVICTPVWLKGDGVGHDVEGMVQILSHAGHRVRVYAPLGCVPAYQKWEIGEAEAREILATPESILIHHHSIGCDPIESMLRDAQSEIRIMRYHNVTPPEFFEGYNDGWVVGCKKGRQATIDVARLCTHYSVPSLYDARDLVHAGVHPDEIHYLPYFHKLADFDLVTPDADTERRLTQDPRFHILFVGRRVPNKGHLHLVRTIGQYVKNFDRNIVLHLIGAADGGLKKYDREILDVIKKEKLKNNVILYDKLSFPEIVAFYKGCDVFLCMSEHEGFCIPIIEAEYCGLPVLAHYRRGVPEALGPTQPWFTSLNYDDYAAKLSEIRRSSSYAQQLKETGQRSVRERFDIEEIGSRFLDWVNGIRGVEGVVESQRRRIAFVVQRYGEGVAGGAESFARMYAERLASTHDVTVISTSSRTMDWDSEIPILDEEYCGGVRVVRFAPDHPRDWEAFGHASILAERGDISFREWLDSHGPKTSEMVNYLRKNAGNYDVVVNWTYLFQTVGYTADLQNQSRLISVPFFHDESFLYYNGHREIAEKFDAYVFQTEAEKKLAEHVGGINRKPFLVLGAGIEEDKIQEVFNASTDKPLDSPYILYIGRIESAKGVDQLFHDFIKFKLRNNSDLKLVMVGRIYRMDVPDHPDIIFPGFIEEFDKFRYIKHAKALINPSNLESFSLVLLESWAFSRPVVVSGGCPATSGQVMRSGGGMVYHNYRDFCWILEQLERDTAEIRQLGVNGNAFYRANYLWEDLLPRFNRFIEQVIRRIPERTQ